MDQVSVRSFAKAFFTAGLLAVGALAQAASVLPPSTDPNVRDVVLVGSNWDGTAEIFDPHTFEVIKTINLVPDRDERMAEIKEEGIKRRVMFQLIRHVIGEGNDQLVDDLFTSHDGRVVYASRPSFADVIAMDMHSGKIIWRTPVEGVRSDHAAISPDGKIFLVSASTARKVHAIDTATGKIIGGWDTGDQPHESTYSADGKTVYHASIGRVFVPTTSKWLDWIKGDRWMQIVDVDGGKFTVSHQVDIGEKLEEFGFPWVDSAVRPGHQQCGHQAVRGGDHVGVRGHRRPQDVRVQDGPAFGRPVGSEALLVHPEPRRQVLLRLGQRTGPGVGHLL